MGYEFSALKPGENGRTCRKCGRVYVPSSRVQKYCPDCKKAARPVHEKPKRDGENAVGKARKSMDANVFSLNEAMFRELERIEECETPEDIEAEGVRADKVCNLASNIIANGRLMLQAAQMSMSVAESVEVPKALLGMGDGR